MFAYPKFDENGVKVLTRMDGVAANMLMDTTAVRLAQGKTATYGDAAKETVVLLVSGKVTLSAGNVSCTADRRDLFSDLPTCLHVCRGGSIKVFAVEDSEYLVIATDNDREFPTRLFEKKDVIRTVSCEGLWENVAVRDVNTIFDYDNAPYSNLVVGEVLARQGRWWSYVPHSHPQPEVYYYRFERKEGFGACFINDEAHTVKDGSVGCFEGGKTHVQVTAPCFPMYCCWMIRHLDGNPWKKTRNVHPDYTWIDENPSFVPKN